MINLKTVLPWWRMSVKWIIVFIPPQIKFHITKRVDTACKNTTDNVEQHALEGSDTKLQGILGLEGNQNFILVIWTRFHFRAYRLKLPRLKNCYWEMVKHLVLQLLLLTWQVHVIMEGLLVLLKQNTPPCQQILYWFPNNPDISDPKVTCIYRSIL